MTLIVREFRTADPRPLYDADAESIEDEPNDVPTLAPAYEAWLANEWSRPELDRGLTTAVLVGGVVAALCTAHTDGGTRYYSAGTGTRRGYRGRGLAKLAKNDSLHRAARRATRRRSRGTTSATGRCRRSTSGSGMCRARPSGGWCASWAEAPQGPARAPSRAYEQYVDCLPMARYMQSASSRSSSVASRLRLVCAAITSSGG